MWKKKGFILLDSDDILPSGKNEHTVRRSSMISRNLERKGLRNITNLPQEFTPLIIDEESKIKAASTDECINKLKQENTSLLNLLADKDKIIESSGIELQKLKSELHQIQQQNVTLAHSNTQMLAELNSRKDRLKLLQHELGCKQGLLVAKRVELEVGMLKCKKTSKFLGPAKSVPCVAPSILKLEDNKNEKRRHVGSQSANIESEETAIAKDLFQVDSSRLPSDPLNDDEAQEHTITSILSDKADKKSDDKSLRVRRQSARFTSEKSKFDEDIFEVKATIFPSSPQDNGEIQQNDGNLLLTNLVQDLEKLSIGRPSRQVTTKVSSYKEVPLNTKMHR